MKNTTRKTLKDAKMPLTNMDITAGIRKKTMVCGKNHQNIDKYIIVV